MTKKDYLPLIEEPGYFTADFYLTMIYTAKTIHGNPEHVLLYRLEPFQIFLS